MVAPNLLVMAHKVSGGSALSIGVMTGGTGYTQLNTNVSGSSNSVGENWTTFPYYGFGSNRVRFYRGMYFSFVVGQNGASGWKIGNYDPITSIWDNYASSYDPSALVDCGTCSGLFSVGNRLFSLAQGSSQHPYYHYTDDGYTFNAATINGTSNYYGGAGRGVIYRNQLFFPCQGGAGGVAFCVFNPSALTTTFITYASLGWTSGSPQGSLCVFNNRLYLLRKDQPGSSASLKLYEFTGGTFVARATLQAAGTLNESTNFYNQTDGFLFPVSNTKMVAICPIDTGNSQATRGTRAWDLTPLTSTTFQVDNVTSTMVPTALRNVADGGATGVLAETNRWTGYVDDNFNTTPGSPQVYIWLLSDQNVGGSYSYYEYVASSSEIGPGTASLSYSFSLPYQTTGGGDYTYASGVLKGYVTSIAQSPVLGRMRLQSVLYGDVLGAAAELSTSKLTFAGRRDPVKAATTAALPSVTAAAQTLTATANGAFPAQDGISIGLNEDVLVKDQAIPSQNGVYELTQVGDGSNPFILTRRSDANTSNVNTGLGAGAWVYVQQGTTQAGTGWYLQLSTQTITFGTTGLPWVQIASLDRKQRIYYSTTETPNMNLATLSGTPTQSYAQDPQVTRNVDVLEDMVADGRTVTTFDWNAAANGFQNGIPFNYMTVPDAA